MTTHWKQKNIWGDAFYLNHGEHPHYEFVLFRDSLSLFYKQIVPVVGDEIMWPDKSGISHLIVTDVERCRDPRDMYFVKAYSMGKMVA